MHTHSRTKRLLSLLLALLMTLSLLDNVTSAFATEVTDSQTVSEDDSTDKESIPDEDEPSEEPVEGQQPENSEEDLNNTDSSVPEESEDSEAPVEDTEEAPEDISNSFVSEDLNSDISEVGLEENDFSSMRLVVLFSGDFVAINGGTVLGNYGNLYLVQYETVEDAANSYVYYKENADAVEPDRVVETATDVTDDDIDIDINEDTNPIDTLNDIEESTNVKKADKVIALIDTGASESDNIIDRVSVIDDVLSGGTHGDAMVEAIVSQNSEARILSIRALDDNGFGTISSLVAAMEYAIDSNVSIINLSLYARTTLSTSVLEYEIDKATEKGIIVVGAAGNDGVDVKDYMPGSVASAYIIGAADETGIRQTISNYGKTVDYNVVAESTSEATAKFSGYISKNGVDSISEILNQGLVFATDYVYEEPTEEPDSDDPFAGYTVDPTKRVEVKYTLVRTDKVDSNETIDSLMYSEEEVIGEKMVGFMRISTDAYSDGDGTYKFKVDAPIVNGYIAGKYMDVVFANGNNGGEQITSGISFDRSTGIATVDENAMSIKSGDFANIQCQVLVPVNSVPQNISQTITIEDVDGNEITSKPVAKYGLLEERIVIPFDGKDSELSIKDIEVYLNGDKAVVNEYWYDASSHTIYFPSVHAAEVYDVHIKINKSVDAVFKAAKVDLSPSFYLASGTDVSKLTGSVTVSSYIYDSTSSGNSIKWPALKDEDVPAIGRNNGAGQSFQTLYPGKDGGTDSDLAWYSIPTNLFGVDFTFHKVSGTHAEMPTVTRNGTEYNCGMYAYCTHANAANTGSHSNHYWEMTYSIYDKWKEGNTTYFALTYLSKLQFNNNTHHQHLGGMLVFAIEDEPEAKPGTLTITKKSSDSTYELTHSVNGTVIGIYSNSACTNEVTRVTISNGKATATLDAGTYYVKEISVSSGYVLNTNAQTVTIAEGGSSSVTVTNTPVVTKGTLTVIKNSTDATYALEHPVNGAVFTVYSNAACTTSVTTMTISDGKASTKLDPGNYWVKETKAPTGYNLDTATYPVTVPDGGNVSISVSDTPTPQPGIIHISKRSSDSSYESKYSLDGTVFTVYSDENCTKSVTTITIKNNAGEAKVNPGNYWVKETKNNSNYVADSTVYPVSVPDNGNVVITAINKPTPKKFSIEKTSTVNSWDLTHPLYSLQGAKYGIYSDSACKTLIETITTDADGNATTSKTYTAGTYYMKETTAPKGYLLDEDIHTVYVDTEGKATITPALQDEPIDDPDYISIQKESNGQRITSSEAVFKVEYFAATSATGTATRTWYYKTINGATQLNISSYLDTSKTNSDFYTNEYGSVVYPLGTIRVTEYSAPTGYVKSDFTLIGHITQGSDGEAEFKWDNNTNKAVVSYTPSEVVIDNTPVYHAISVTKNEGKPSGDANFEGIQVTIYSANENDIVLKNGTTVKTNGVVATITLNAAGTGKTEAILPPGSYYAKETKGNSWYNVDPNWVSQPITVAPNNTSQTIPVALTDDAKLGGIKITKGDARTNSTSEPEGNGTFAGAVFRIYNRSANAVVVNGKTYAVGVTVMDVTTNENGVAETGIVLPLGTYGVKEITPPAGYRLPSPNDEMSISLTAEGVSKALPTVYDQPILGGVSVPKIDAERDEAVPQGEATLSGAEFTIYNRSAHSVTVGGTSYKPGEAVKVITTNNQGKATTGTTDLPYGDYEIKETKAPNGYRLPDNNTPIQFSVTEQGKVVEVNTVVEDTPVHGGVKIAKVNGRKTSELEGDGTLAGAAFAIYNKSTESVYVDGTLYASGARVAIIYTEYVDGKYIAQTPADYLPYGKYEVVEYTPSTGYLLPTDNTAKAFSITSDHQMVDLTKDAFVEPIISGGIATTKIDAQRDSAVPQGDATLAGAEIIIYNKSANPIWVNGTKYDVGAAVTTITTNANGVASTGNTLLPYGTYELKETKASKGYLLNTQWVQTVEIRENGTTYSTSSNLPETVIKGGVKVAKVDAKRNESVPEGDATLAGAKFAITNKSGESVYVNGKWYANGEVIDSAYIVTNAEGIATTTASLLPYGKYEVIEIEPSTGYLLPVDNTPRSFTISEQSVIVDLTDKPFIEPIIEGTITVPKFDRDRDEGVAQGNASLAGAEITVTNKSAKSVYVGDTEYAPGDVIITITTDANGVATTGNLTLPYGTYELRETKAPIGYKANTNWVQTVIIAENGENVPAEPVKDEVIRGGLKFQKVDDETVTEQGDSKLLKAEYEIINKSAESVWIDGKEYKPGESYHVWTDASGYYESAVDLLPYGKYSLKEVTPPVGYLLDTNEYNFSIEKNGEIVELGYTLKDKVIRGGLQLTKLDYNLGIDGGNKTDMSNIKYDVINRSSKPVLVDGKMYAVGEVITSIYTHWNEDLNKYTAETADDYLPYGTYEVIEKSTEKHNQDANTYYTYTDKTARVVEIREDGVVVTNVAGGEQDDLTFVNRLKRFGVKFSKVDENTNKGIQVPFLITNIDTGEKHVVVTGTNGVFNSELPGHSNVDDTNLNDWVLDDVRNGLKDEDEYRIHMADLDTTGGIWFSTVVDGIDHEIDFNNCALPAGTYTVQELYSDSNIGRAMVSETFVVDYTMASGTVLDLGTITNKEDPWIATLATGSGWVYEKHDELVADEPVRATTSEHLALGRGTQVIEDKVSLFNLVPGQKYKLVATVYTVDSEGAIQVHNMDGTALTGSVEFTAESAFYQEQTVSLEFNADFLRENGVKDAWSYKGLERNDPPYTIVVYEELYKIDSRGKVEANPVADHTEWDDEEQQIHFPKITSDSRDKYTDDNVGTIRHEDGKSAIVDVVHYQNVIPGIEYRVDGILYDHDTGKPALDAEGHEITASKYFTPEESKGDITIEFNFTGRCLINGEESDIEGKTFVAFETLSVHNVVIAIDDNYRVDWVYDNARDGHIVESIEWQDEQTIYFPKYSTETRSYGTEDHVGAYVDGNSIGIIDTVTLENLVVGKEYTAIGVLYDNGETEYKAVIAGYNTYDKSYNGLVSGDTYNTATNALVGGNGTVMKDIDGNDAIEARTFTVKAPADDPTAKTASMTFEFEFILPYESARDAFTTHVTDSLNHPNAITGENVEVLWHENLDTNLERNNELEKIHFPDFVTLAEDGKTNDHVGTVEEKATITDTITYKNMLIGQYYEFEGKLIDRTASNEAGETVYILDENGEPYTVYYGFTAEEHNDGERDKAVSSDGGITVDGIQQMEFKLNSLDLEGHTIVVEEHLYHGIKNSNSPEDMIEIRRHDDVNEELESIHYPKIRTKAVDDSTTNVDKKYSGTKDDVGTVIKDGRIIDTVSYWNLVPGMKYRLDGYLMDQETQERLNINGKDIEAVRVIINGKEVDVDDGYFIAGEVDGDTEVDGGINGEMQVIYDLDTTSLPNRSVVAYEFLYHNKDYNNGEEVEVTRHNDITDKSQTIHYPWIRTTASDSETGDHVGSIFGGAINFFRGLLGINEKDTQTVYDDVILKNLVPGRTYTIEGKVVLVSTGETVSDGTGIETVTFDVTEDYKIQLHDVDTKTKVDDKDEDLNRVDATITLNFNIDSSVNTDETEVVYEYLYHNDVEVNKHEDDKDSEQFVNNINLTSTLVDIHTGDHVGDVPRHESTNDIISDEDTTTLRETLNMSKLVYGMNYTVEGRLVVVEDSQESGKVTYLAKDKKSFTTDRDAAYVVPAFITANENLDGYVGDTDAISEYRINTSVERDSRVFSVAGNVTLEFILDSDVVAGKTLAVVDEVSHNDVIISVHGGLNKEDKFEPDETQAVHFPEIRTNAYDGETKDHVGTVGKTQIIDVVTFDNLIAGQEYTLEATAHIRNEQTGKESGILEDAEGKEIKATATFIAGNEDAEPVNVNYYTTGQQSVPESGRTTWDGVEHVSGTYTFTFEVDASLLEDTTVVMFEELKHNNVTVDVHADISDESQSIHYPKIRTNAVDDLTGDEVGTVIKNDSITDTVTYNNLVPDMTYTVTGIVHGRDNYTGEDLGVLYIGDDGNYEFKQYDGDEGAVISERTFKAGQTEDGLTATLNATNQSYDGAVELHYNLDASKLEGVTLVVFEKLWHNEVEVTRHEDISDEAQTIHYPKIRTNAIDDLTGDEVGAVKPNEVNINEMDAIRDRVSFWNLVPGKTYRISGLMMNYDTEEAIEVDGKTVTSYVDLTAGDDGYELVYGDDAKTNVEGKIDVVFDVNAETLANVTAVVFEKLWHNDVEVTRHEDINDHDQTIHYPEIFTTATDGETKDHVGTVEHEAQIIDVVEFHDLVKGKKYTLTGTAHVKETWDAESPDDSILVDAVGSTIQVTKTFTAGVDDGFMTIDKEEEVNGRIRVSGTYTLTFDLDSSLLEGKTVVIFEDLYHNDVLVETHSDINDEDQSVHYPKIRTKAVDEQTQDGIGVIWGKFINFILGREEDEKTTIIDTITYENLLPGMTYEFKGTLMNKDTGEAIQDGDDVVTLKADKADGEVKMYFTVDSSELTAVGSIEDAHGVSTVVYEKLFHGVEDAKTDDGKVDPDKRVEVTRHEDITDDDQSVYYINLKSEAIDVSTKDVHGNDTNRIVDEAEAVGTTDHVGTISKDARIQDTLTFEKAIKGMEYTIKGYVVKRGTNDVVAEKTMKLVAGEDNVTVLSVDEEGNETWVVDTKNAVLTYTDKETGESKNEFNGNIVVYYDLDSTILENETVVVYTDVYHNDTLITRHPVSLEEINAQSIHYPEIRTNAYDSDTDDTVGTVTTESNVIDHVAYKNLLLGHEYTISGKLIDQKTGLPILDAFGREITASATFVATAESDPDPVSSDPVEEPVDEPTEPTEPTEGPVDEPTEPTEPTDEPVDEPTEPTEPVIPDEIHKFAEEFGIGANKVTDVDEEHGEVSGVYTLVFTVDSTLLQGSTAVVFEDLHHNDVNIATHSDITDKAQTVHYPDIYTTAVDSETGDHVGSIWGTIVNGVRNLFGETDADGNGIPDDKQQNVIDTVKLLNLVPGYEYTVTGKLMDADTGEAIIIDDAEVVQTALIKVTEDGKLELVDGSAENLTVLVYDKEHNQVDATVDLVYSFDADTVQGKTLVVFEKLLHKNLKTDADIEVNQHEDLADTEQSVNDVEIHTTAIDASTGDQVGKLPEDKEGGFTVIKDTVHMEKLVNGMEYRIVGRLVDQDASTSEKIAYVLDGQGNVITSERKFTASSEDEGFSVTTDVDLFFTIGTDANIEGRNVIVVEDLYHNDVLISTHSDITDSTQAIYYPTGKTNAVADSTGKHEMLATSEQVITDSVYFENLLEGKEYTVTGEVYLKSSGEVLKDVEGNNITSTRSFTTSSENVEDGTIYDVVTRIAADGTTMYSGYIDLTFVVDASALAGEDVVVAENLKHNDVDIFVHKDLEDLPQTIKIPAIGTSAKSGNLDEAVAYNWDENGVLTGITITDTVKYSNLWTAESLKKLHNDGLVIKGGTVDSIRSAIYNINEGNEEQVPHYIAKGVLMDKSTGEAVVNNEGKQYVVYSDVFTPDNTDGEVDVVFELNTQDFVTDGISSLANTTVVVFEDLYRAEDAENLPDQPIAQHHDISDTEQDIRFPNVYSHIHDMATEDAIPEHGAESVTDYHDVLASNSVNIVDRIFYENLHGSTEYTVTAVLFDMTSGETVKNAKGEEVSYEGTFKTVGEYEDHVDGFVDVTFPTFDATALAGHTLVSIFTVSRNGQLIASPANIYDEAEQINLPKIGTMAGVLETPEGFHEATSANQMVLVDTVSYENLKPGQTYIVAGYLMVKETGDPVRSDGKVLVAGKQFTVPEDAEVNPLTGGVDGTVEVEFHINVSELRGKTLVAFERLYVGTKLVATHEDINDNDQMITVPDLHTSATIDGKKVATASKKTVVKDEVTFTNLHVGETYKIVGTLMDKETGKPITVNGNPVTKSVEFKPNVASGSITVSFEFDSTSYGNHDLVVFEKLFRSDIEVAVHEDINDNDQTVHINVIPKTGDESPYNLFIGMAIASAVTAGFVVFLMLKKRRTNK